MNKIGQAALMMALATGLAACGGQGANNAALPAENLAPPVEAPANVAADAVENAAQASPELNTAAPAIAAPPRERAKAERPAPRPKAEAPRRTPPVDPHAGHDMSNMSH